MYPHAKLYIQTKYNEKQMRVKTNINVIKYLEEQNHLLSLYFLLVPSLEEQSLPNSKPLFFYCENIFFFFHRAALVQPRWWCRHLNKVPVQNFLSCFTCFFGFFFFFFSVCAPVGNFARVARGWGWWGKNSLLHVNLCCPRAFYDTLWLIYFLPHIFLNYGSDDTC